MLVPEIDKFKSKETSKTVKGVIIDAYYIEEDKILYVKLNLSNKQIVVGLDSEAFTYNGKTADETDISIIHKEMLKTRDLFKKSKGRQIKLEVCESQIQG